MVSGAPAGARLERIFKSQWFRVSSGNRLIEVSLAGRRKLKAEPLAMVRERPPARIASAPSQVPPMSTAWLPAWRSTISTERACRPEKVNVFASEGRAAAST